jgi:uncharacterized membrane protein (UPF0127 family)
MIMNKELDKRTTWNGTYKGVKFEIVQWRIGWCYYLIIPVDQLPEAIKPIFNLRLKTTKLGGSKPMSFFDYSDVRIVADLDWHGGITYYEKLRSDNGKVFGYKLGCDYSHYWDMNNTYTVDSVYIDVKKSIETLYRLVPDIKLRCAYNGKYYNQDEVYYNEHGVCIALENKEAWNKPIGTK